MALGGLRQSQIVKIVRGRLLEIRASKSDVAELKNLRIENSWHHFLRKVSSSPRRRVGETHGSAANGAQSYRVDEGSRLQPSHRRRAFTRLTGYGCESLGG